MEIRLAKNLDAWVGRLIDFVGADPLRSHTRVKFPRPPARTSPTGPTGPTSPTGPTARTPAPPPEPPRELEAPEPPAPEPPTPEPPAPEPPRELEAPEPPAETVVAEELVDEDLERRILSFLAAKESAAMKEIVEATGATRYASGQALKALVGQGRVRRVGAGLKTRYEKTDDRGENP